MAIGSGERRGFISPEVAPRLGGAGSARYRRSLPFPVLLIMNSKTFLASKVLLNLDHTVKELDLEEQPLNRRFLFVDKEWDHSLMTLSVSEIKLLPENIRKLFSTPVKAVRQLHVGLLLWAAQVAGEAGLLNY